MFKVAKSFLNGFARKVLDLDDTVKPTSHLDLFEDYLGKFSFNTNTNSIEIFLKELKKKHLVDDIVVSSLNGSSIASTNGHAISSAVTGAALYNYVQSEIPKSQSVIIKADNWHMIIPYNGKLYIVRASSDLSTIELKALAKEIDKFLVKSS
ncbi:MAG: hypothetical protein COV47_04150 [Candidatus Diapherotrites archaeon CG11_big_fil_rev_8_21_14_0_20_37_9]|nr:MAG: hypothetical protein COV47_04150 [Candidatus Diapherotrites archaeon CG11_big_fil_rev_8_21_14_0_20_37_9]